MGLSADQLISGGLGERRALRSDTAGVVLALDLVVTVDTSVAHLAGGLGKPVWVLPPRAGDWRWMFDIEDSPWYPTMRLFRQGRGETWEPGGSATLARIEHRRARRSNPFDAFSRAMGERRAAQAADITAIESEQAENIAWQAARQSNGCVGCRAIKVRFFRLLVVNVAS